MALAQVNFFSNCLMRQVTMSAVIPMGKLDFSGGAPQEKKPLKTLYLLHGISGSHLDWLSGTRIQAWAEARNLAVIMPSGDNHFYVDNERSGNRYGEFVGRELVEATRALFPLSTRREDTYIAGLSMGGFGALRNGLKYAETFGCLAGLSSALVLENALRSTEDAETMAGKRGYFESVFGDLSRLMDSDKNPVWLVKSMLESGAAFPEIYLCCGTEDFLLEANRQFHQFLQERGVKHTYVEGPGAHTWEYWDTYIQKVLDWLPLDKTNPGDAHV